MAVGQGVLTSVLDVAALDRVETRLAVSAVEDCHRHAELLRDVLEMHRVFTGRSADDSTVAQVALCRQVSEQAARGWLVQAQLLTSLPGGLEALDCGLLTVDQATVLTRHLAPLDPEVQQQVWARVQARLLAALDGGAVLPQARFGELVRTAVLNADPRDAVERRRAAEADGDVEYRQRADGLVDVFATGITAPNAQAVLQKVRSAARPFGPDDQRSAGKRRLDGLVDLLLGREQLDLSAWDTPTVTDSPVLKDGLVRHCGPACGCRLSSPVPCGADMTVLVPLGAALGTSDEPATLSGHGPLEPDLTDALLLSAPRIRLVWVDQDGVPVAVDDTVHVPPRDDPAALQDLLLRLSRQRPPHPLVPRHPGDHPPDDSGDGAPPPPPDHPPAPTPRHATSSSPAAPQRPSDSGMPARAGLRRPQLVTNTHPVGTPGPYRLPRRLERLIRLRAPRCEWPGCGIRAVNCDDEHDLAHPYGPTCGCNTGPLCRRHHRLKQQLMTKQRTHRSAVLWTDPTGRTWTSPSQHQPPAPAVRELPSTDRPEEPDLPWCDDPEDDTDLDPVRYELRAVDTDPDHGPATDLMADRIEADTGWGLSLDDPYRWTA